MKWAMLYLPAIVTLVCAALAAAGASELVGAVGLPFIVVAIFVRLHWRLNREDR